MIQFTPHMRILAATMPLDMRKGIDAMAAVCRLELSENPMSGAVFVFTSRSRRQLRILTYDGQGFWAATKRLSRGRFPYWPETPDAAGGWLQRLEACEAQVLVHAGDPRRIDLAKDWKKIEEPRLF